MLISIYLVSRDLKHTCLPVVRMDLYVSKLCFFIDVYNTIQSLVTVIYHELLTVIFVVKDYYFIYTVTYIVDLKSYLKVVGEKVLVQQGRVQT